MATACGGGGGGAAPTSPEPAPTALRPADLAVLYAAGDATSESIARAYQQARGIPDANVLAVTLPTRTDVMSSADFNAMKTALDARLPATVQATLLTWTAPSRVAGTCTMGLTAAMALGYDTRYCGGCAATNTTAYYNSSSAQPWTALRIRPSMMLGAATLAEAQVLINRGVAADRSMRAAGANANAFFVRTDDAERSVRWNDFRSTASSTVSGLQFNLVDNAAGTSSNDITGRSQLLFYLTGAVRVNNAVSNTWLPGAVADHLTSFGGVLPDGNGQMPITEWLRAGATASYGTVEEPCAYEQKFPRASVLVNRYVQGDTLIEAYWKSVQWPGQGLFVGEPLARPWAP
ncbi:hypothetical protein IP87_15780 [beta proteobacterium AAP121]|nr:hypothetical protein IP80_14870 [beta proteobacterium AAP65]KPF95879.1 hypothetical protein IP87_15780 [beta proteobacterium AAP121]